ncbi:MAG: lasso peptide biosynthesis B2 protein [Candidatus Acidiferrum sp.]
MELDAEARKLFWRAAIVLPLISLSLRSRGFKQTKKTLENRLRVAPPQRMLQGRPTQTVERTCRMLRAGAHYGLVQPTCLAESLALWYLLRKQGLSADLRIGVRKESQKFQAHAWVEFEGAALNQREEQHRHYAAFDSGSSDVPGDQR